MIDALILCGGLGTRLQSRVSDKPKGLAGLEGRSFLDVQLDWMAVQGITRVIFCTGHLGDQIEHHFHSSPHSIELVFSRETEPLGTAGALRLARDHIISDPFFVFNGDSFCDVDLNQVVHHFHAKSAIASMVLVRAQDSSDFGQVRMDADQRVIQFSEKNTDTISDWINGGVYCLSQDIFDILPSTKPLSLEKECFPLLVNKSFYGFPSSGIFFDIGTPERLDQAQEKMKDYFEKH